MFKCLGYHVDGRFSFNEHCKRMLQKVQKNSGILKYITRSKTSSTKARNLISQAFIHPYLQMMYVVWPILSVSSVEKNRSEKSTVVSSHSHGEMRPLTKCDGYQTTRQQNQKHSASFVDSSIKLQRSHLSFSKIIL